MSFENSSIKALAAVQTHDVISTTPRLCMPFQRFLPGTYVKSTCKNHALPLRAPFVFLWPSLQGLLWGYLLPIGSCLSLSLCTQAFCPNSAHLVRDMLTKGSLWAGPSVGLVYSAPGVPSYSSRLETGPSDHITLWKCLSQCGQEGVPLKTSLSQTD